MLLLSPTDIFPIKIFFSFFFTWNYVSIFAGSKNNRIVKVKIDFIWIFTMFVSVPNGLKIYFLSIKFLIANIFGTELLFCGKTSGHWIEFLNYFNLYEKKQKCTGRESNPGRPRGRRAFYHWTTSACYFRPFEFALNPWKPSKVFLLINLICLVFKLEFFFV